MNLVISTDKVQFSSESP